MAQAGGRSRRTLTAIALALFVYAGNEALGAGGAAFDRLSQSASGQRATLQRRIRVAEHRAEQSQASLAALSARTAPSLAQISHQLALLARNQPSDSALNSATFDDRGLSVAGAAYSSDATELALRRAFEGARVSFTGEPGAAPAPFQARIDVSAEAPQ